jgi:signal peptidase I
MEKPQEKAPVQRSVVREYNEAILIAMLFLVFANTFVVKTFYIPSSSMEDTLLIGDHLFVNRFIYGPAATGIERALLPLRPVARGDIVVFRSPQEPTLDVVKRCIGVPGDVIEIVKKELRINGQVVDDSAYVQHKDPLTYPDLPAYQPDHRDRDNMPPYTVPAGHYFCLGDNRDHSYDSRYWGPLPAHLVKGRAVLVYWSYGGEVGDGGREDVGARVQRLGKTLAGFFRNTRWERTFHLVR